MKIAKHTGKRGEKNPSAIRAGKTGSHKNPGKWMANGFLLPSILGVLLFFVLPFFIVIYYSVIDNPINAEFVGFDNFKMVFENAAFRQAAFNTMTFSAIAMPLAVVLSLLLAILMESKIPFKSQFRTFFLSPMMVPIASVVLIWQVLFHYNGMMNEVIGWFGKDKIDWLNSDYVCPEQYTEGYLRGSGIGECNADADFLAYQAPVSVLDHFVCDNYVID